MAKLLEFQQSLTELLLTADVDECSAWTRNALQEGVSPLDFFN